MKSRSRHFLPALMLASMLPFTIMHYMILQINHNNCFASRLTEGCMSCTLKSDVSILPAILMLTLMLIISSIKALCFLTTRTQQYHYIGNCLSPILWGSDNLFLSAMMFTILLTFNCSFFKCLFLCPQRNFGRHIVIALSVRPSVRQSVRPSVCPSRFRVRSISPIFFELGIPNLVCLYILGWRSVAYHFRVTVTLTLTSDLVFIIIMSGAYLLYYLS